MSVDNSAAGCLRELPIGGSGAGGAAVTVHSISDALGRIDSGGRADSVRQSTDGCMERAPTTEDQARREDHARHEGKKSALKFEFQSLEALRVQWQLDRLK